MILDVVEIDRAAGGLGLALRALGLEQKKVWMEDPGSPFTRHGLELARLSIEPIPVDKDGIGVGYGLKHAPDAALVVVTPGQRTEHSMFRSQGKRRRSDWRLLRYRSGMGRMLRRNPACCSASLHLR